MFEYTKGRFVNPHRIVGASIYNKDNTVRVAIEIDVSQKENNAIFSGPFADYVAAETFIKTIPVLPSK